MKDLDIDVSWDNLHLVAKVFVTGCLMGFLGLVIGALTMLFILILWLANTLLY